ncbi:hypothetical protein PMAYCL1PPCAC_15919, partial [Pristionchus mayeri]
ARPSFFSLSFLSPFPRALPASSRLLPWKSPWIRLRSVRDWAENLQIDSDSCPIALSRSRFRRLTSLLRTSHRCKCPYLPPPSPRLPLNGLDSLSPMCSFPAEIVPIAEEKRAS